MDKPISSVTSSLTTQPSTKNSKRLRTIKIVKMFYLKHQLGCKMYSKIEDYPHLPIELFRRGPRNMPKCEHHDLYCKVGVSRGKKKVRAFFSCSAAFPDTPCNFFRWLKDYLPRQEQQQPPEPPVYFPPQRQDLSAPPPAKRQRKRQPAPRPFFNNTNPYILSDVSVDDEFSSDHLLVSFSLATKVKRLNDELFTT